MKTSTKILFVYGAVLVAVQSVCLVNSLMRYPEVKRLGQEMCEVLDTTKIRHIEADISDAKYERDKRRWEGRDTAPWIEKSKNYRSFYFGANLRTSHISGDTLYINATYDDLSYHPTTVPELRTATIITQEGAVEKRY